LNKDSRREQAPSANAKLRIQRVGIFAKLTAKIGFLRCPQATAARIQLQASPNRESGLRVADSTIKKM
jgi:hypothetical protein